MGTCIERIGGKLVCAANRQADGCSARDGTGEGRDVYSPDPPSLFSGNKYNIGLSTNGGLLCNHRCLSFHSSRSLRSSVFSAGRKVMERALVLQTSPASPSRIQTGSSSTASRPQRAS